MAGPYTGHIEARIVGRLHGQDCINVLHFATHTTINDGNRNDLLLQLAQALLDCAISTLLPAVTSEYTLTQVEAKFIAPTVSDPIAVTPSGTNVGSRGPTSVSFQSSLLSLRTGGGGRRGRGKMFLAPAGEADITASNLDGPTVALLAAFAACLVGKFVGTSASTAFLLGVLSKTAIKVSGSSFDNAFREVTTITPNALLAKIGSRKVGKGS